MDPTMKRAILLFNVLVFITGMLGAQPRDRRVDLDIPCGYHIDLSTTGRLWIADRCGNIYTADSMGATWRTVTKNEDELHISGCTFERVAAFGEDVAVAAGYMHQKGYVLRTTTAGAVWDTVQVDSNLIWVHGFCYHADGRLWIAAASGRSFKCMAYSTDRGRTFSTLMPPFVNMNDGEGGIHELYMVTADSGFAGAYGGKIYSASDNWRTAHRWVSPIEQEVMEKNKYTDSWVNCIRPWRGWLIATLCQSTFCTPMGSTLKWQTLPWATYEVDTVSGNLWAITTSGQLLYLTDMGHHQVVLDRADGSIIGTLGGSAYLRTSTGVVRISPDGKADTCGFYTEEQTIEEAFAELIDSHGEYASEYLPTLSHGGRLWRHDGKSVYLQDAIGWYRIAKPLGVREMNPDPDREDRVIILRGDGKNYSVDTAGHIEPYTYLQPLSHFVESGLQSVEIKTYVSGCFHYDEHVVTFTREGDRLRECENTVDSNRLVTRSVVADSIERTLLRMGERYSLFPSPCDFGLEEGDVDLEKVYLGDHGWCTSGSGYGLVFINRKGDTLIARGHSDVNCGNYFPWMLPMTFKGDSAAFVTYQPMLWKALLPMMPEGMMHRSFLSNISLVGLRPGDLLFFADSKGMGHAIKESTGHYTHVAIVESTSRDTVWVIDATPEEGVARRPLRYRRGFFPDIYRLKADISNVEIDSILNRARSYIGQPYDNAFLPDNGALYCSELIYECYLDEFHSGNYPGDHLFEAKPMNWRNAKGKLPRYWKKHFRKLRMKVPEGVPGTNPTDLARSPLLRKL